MGEMGEFFADEEALNSAIGQVVQEVDELYEEIGRLQEIWKSTFVDVGPNSNELLLEYAGQQERYGDFVWAALTTNYNYEYEDENLIPADYDDIVPFLEDVIPDIRDESRQGWAAPAEYHYGGASAHDTTAYASSNQANAANPDFNSSDVRPRADTSSDSDGYSCIAYLFEDCDKRDEVKPVEIPAEQLKHKTERTSIPSEHRDVPSCSRSTHGLVRDHLAHKPVLSRTLSDYRCECSMPNLLSMETISDPNCLAPPQILRRTSSTPGLSDSSSQPLDQNLSPRLMSTPFLERTSHSLTDSNAHAMSASTSLPFLLTNDDTNVATQALFSAQLESVCETLDEMSVPLVTNSLIKKHLLSALRALSLAKFEINGGAFRSWKDIGFECIDPDDNKRSQKLLRNNVIITGVPVTDNENILDIVKRIGNRLNYRLFDAYIKEALRIKTYNASQHPLIIKFRNPTVRDVLLKIASSKTIYSDELGLNTHERNPVYIYQQLTPFNVHLLDRAKELKDQGFIDLWVENGKIWTKIMHRGSDVIQLDSLEKLGELKRQFADALNETT